MGAYQDKAGIGAGKVAKTYTQINEKIQKGAVVVVTAEEMAEIVADKGVRKAAREVDVVTTGTFGPMCSSGVFLNLGHSKPRIKYEKLLLNDVPAYTGLAAVDVYLGATALQEGDPDNKVFPGRFRYGGGHVIEDLVSGRAVNLKGTAYGTDCYPRREIEKSITLRDIPQAILTSPRNACQNYNVAVNKSDKVIYTYMGILKPRLGNAGYCTAGQLSPLLNDPFYRTIGIGTRIFIGGTLGYVWGAGTQHNPDAVRTERGVPETAAGTLAVTGNLREMSPRWIRGASFTGYGVTLAIGIGIPIPVLDEEMAKYTAVRDEDIRMQVIDYSRDYPNGRNRVLATVNYRELREGKITVGGKDVPAGGLSSYANARAIANILKQMIQNGEFFLSEPVAGLPGAKR